MTVDSRIEYRATQKTARCEWQTSNVCWDFKDFSPWKPLVITPRKAVRDLGGFAGEVPQGDSFRMVRRGGCRCDRDHPSPGSDLDRTCTGGDHPQPRLLPDPCRRADR